MRKAQAIKAVNSFVPGDRPELPALMYVATKRKTDTPTTSKKTMSRWRLFMQKDSDSTVIVPAGRGTSLI